VNTAQWADIGPGPVNSSVLRAINLPVGTLVAVVSQRRGYKSASLSAPSDEVVVLSEEVAAIVLLPGLAVNVVAPGANLQVPSPAPAPSSPEPSPADDGQPT